MSACCGGHSHHYHQGGGDELSHSHHKHITVVGCLTDYLCGEEETGGVYGDGRRLSNSSVSGRAKNRPKSIDDGTACSDVHLEHRRVMKRNGHTMISLTSAEEDITSMMIHCGGGHGEEQCLSHHNPAEIPNEKEVTSTPRQRSPKSSSSAADLAFEQKLTDNIQRQLDEVAENYAYRTALEEVAGDQYEEAYFASYRKGEALGRESAMAVVELIQTAFASKRRKQDVSA